jgi:hypothetical protein
VKDETPNPHLQENPKHKAVETLFTFNQIPTTSQILQENKNEKKTLFTLNQIPTT